MKKRFKKLAKHFSKWFSALSTTKKFFYIIAFLLLLDGFVYAVKESYVLATFYKAKNDYEKALQARKQNKEKTKPNKKSKLAKEIEKKAKLHGFYTTLKKYHDKIEFVNFFVFKDANTKERNVIPIALLTDGSKAFLGREIMVDSNIFIQPVKEWSIPFKITDSPKMPFGQKFERSNENNSAVQPISLPKLEHAQMLTTYMLKRDPGTVLIMLLILYFLMMGLAPLHESKNKMFEKYNPEEIDGSLNDLIGMEEIKEEVLQLKDLLQNKRKYEDFGIKNTFNIMFSGPAGTGKTRMAMFLAKELRLPLIVGTGNVETGLVGGGAMNIRRIFNEARLAAAKNGGAIIFLDEAQVLLRKRGEGRNKWEDDSANELLAQLDGVNSETEDENIIFIAASNFNSDNMKIDEAMERRFKKKIFFRYPSYEERKRLFEHFLQRVQKERKEEKIDIEDLAKITTGHSPAKIETIVEEASLMAIRKNRPLNTELLMKAFEKVNVGMTTREVSKEQERMRDIIILHELGHFICEYSYLKKLYKGNLKKMEEKSSLLKISSEGISSFKGALGYVLHAKDESLKNLEEMEEEIIELFGGMASEEHFFGEKGVTTGAHNDLEKVGFLLKILVKDMGFYGKGKFNSSSFGSEKNNFEKIAEDVSEKLYEKAKKRVRENEELMLFLYYHLHRRWFLTKKEIFSLIHAFELQKKENNDEKTSQSNQGLLQSASGER